MIWKWTLLDASEAGNTSDMEESSDEDEAGAFDEDIENTLSENDEGCEADVESLGTYSVIFS